MAQKIKGIKVKMRIQNIIIIRHALAIIETLLIVFWRNYFKDGIYLMPDKLEMKMVYDLWEGKYEGSQAYKYESK